MQNEYANKDAIVAIRQALQDAMNQMAVQTYARFSTNGCPTELFDEGIYPRGRGYEGRHSRAPSVIQDVDDKIMVEFKRLAKLLQMAEGDAQSRMHDFPAFKQVADGIKKINAGEEKRIDLTGSGGDECD